MSLFQKCLCNHFACFPSSLICQSSLLPKEALFHPSVFYFLFSIYQLLFYTPLISSNTPLSFTTAFKIMSFHNCFSINYLVLLTAKWPCLLNFYFIIEACRFYRCSLYFPFCSCLILLKFGVRITPLTLSWVIPSIFVNFQLYCWGILRQFQNCSLDQHIRFSST